MIYELSITSSLLATMSFVFFLVGCIGYASDKILMKYLPWITAHENDEKKYFNLSGMYYNGSGGEGALLFATVDCTEEFCDRCAGVGNTALNLLVVAAMLTPLITFSSAYLALHRAHKLQTGNVLLTCAAFVSSVTGFALFMNSCTFQSDDSTPLRTQYGTGAIITLLGILLMGIVLICQTIVFLDDFFALRPEDFANYPAIIVILTPTGQLMISPNFEHYWFQPLSTRLYPKLPKKVDKVTLGA